MNVLLEKPTAGADKVMLMISVSVSVSVLVSVVDPVSVSISIFIPHRNLLSCGIDMTCVLYCFIFLKELMYHYGIRSHGKMGLQ